MESWTARSLRRPTAAIPITSLLDALTILLVFMLVNYSESPPAENIARLPWVGAQSGEPAGTELKEAIHVHISDSTLRVGDKTLRLSELAGQDGGDGAARLRAWLAESVRELRERGKPARLYLGADAETPYRWIDLVVREASGQGIGRVRFLGRSKTEGGA